jgi:putative lipoprotein
MVAMIFLTCSHAQAAEPDPDPWWGKDKALHAGISFALASGSYGISTWLVRPKWQRIALASSVALGAGISKELWDLSGHGDPSWRDFTWDVIGTALGVTAAWLLDLALSPAPQSQSQQTTQALSPQAFSWTW